MVGRGTFFFGAVWLSRAVIISKFSVLLGCSFTGPLARKNWFCLGFFFFFGLNLLAFLGCWLLQFKSGTYEANENFRNPSLCHSLSPGLPSSPSFLIIFDIYVGIWIYRWVMDI